MVWTHDGVRRAGWEHLLDMSISDKKESRLVALIRGYAWVESALDAAGALGPRRPIAARILKALTDPNLIRDIDEEKVRQAVNIRHRATHQDDVPDQHNAREAVKIFRDIWHALSRHFVNLDSAVEIGSMFINKPNVDAVALYGSLAYEGEEPNDIDLIVIDDGRYSEYVHPSPYSKGNFSMLRTTLKVLNLVGVDSPKLKQCARCRWLDILIIDGDLFGKDPAYTTEMCEAQPDKWFFLNIARHLKELNIERRCYVETRRSPFYELCKLYQQIEEMGLVVDD